MNSSDLLVRQTKSALSGRLGRDKASRLSRWKHASFSAAPMCERNWRQQALRNVGQRSPKAARHAVSEGLAGSHWMYAHKPNGFYVSCEAGPEIRDERRIEKRVVAPVAAPKADPRERSMPAGRCSELSFRGCRPRRKAWHATLCVSPEQACYVALHHQDHTL